MSLFHRNKKNVNHGIKKMDAIITGLVLGGIVASVYGIKKHEQEKHLEEKIEYPDGKITYSSIFKSLLFGFKEKEKEPETERPSLIRRIIASPFILIRRLGKK